MGEENTTQATGQEPNEAGLRELAIRLLAMRYPGMPEGEVPQLLVGQLPPNLPLELPMPEGSRAVGSFVQGDATIVVDTELALEDVIEYYQARLGTSGWSLDTPPGGLRGGFVHAEAGERWFANFYRGDQDSWLSVAALPGPDGRTTVHLNLHRDAHGGPPYRGRRRHGPGMDMWEVLPAIRPPWKARQFAEGGSGGSERVHAIARLETDLDLAAVQEHYLEQLERAGWERRDAGESGPVGWSVWAFHDKESAPWRALLIIVKQPDVSGRYVLQLSAELVGNGPSAGNRGWAATASRFSTISS